MQDLHHSIHTVTFDRGVSTCSGVSSITGLPGEDFLGGTLYPNSFALLQADLPESHQLSAFKNSKSKTKVIHRARQHTTRGDVLAQKDIGYYKVKQAHSFHTKANKGDDESIASSNLLVEIIAIRQKAFAAKVDGGDEESIASSTEGMSRDLLEEILMIRQKTSVDEDAEEAPVVVTIRAPVVTIRAPAKVSPSKRSFQENSASSLAMGPGAFHVAGISCAQEESSTSSFEVTDASFGLNLSSTPSHSAAEEVALNGFLVVEGMDEVDESKSCDLKVPPCTTKLGDLEEAIDVKPYLPRKKTGGAKPSIPSESASRALHCRKYVLVLMLLFTLSCAILAGVLARRRIGEADTDWTLAPTTQGEQEMEVSSSIMYPPFDPDLLLASTVKAIEEDTESPQYKANLWMWNDPLLQTYLPWQQQQRFALVAKYYATGGQDWFRNDNWLSYSVSECDWYSGTSTYSYPTCDAEGRIIVQDLSGNNLYGIMPKEAQMESMLIADHSHNRLFGPFPTFSKKSAIQVFSVANNDFEGPLIGDAGFGSDTVREIRLDGNRFEGNVFKALPLFPNLEMLNVTGNYFSGTIPTEVSFTTKLTYLGMGDNRFSGSVPTEFGLLASLEELDLSGNPSATGSLPTVLGSLKHLKRLDITETAITGPLPAGLCISRILGIAPNCSIVDCC